MATGDRVFMAKESTSQEILSKTNQIIEAGREKPKRYGMRINRLDSNPATRVKYILDAVGMTPGGDELLRRRVRLWRLGRHLVRKEQPSGHAADGWNGGL